MLNTGKLKWHYQFTPHDTHDWDAQEFPVLIDTNFQGKPRKLLVQANRNGFFYVLDRTDGKVLVAKPFVKKMTWARGILPNGRPDVIPDMDPTPAGRIACPGIKGASNWFSPSYNPETGLFYVITIEQCDIYTTSARPYKKGECYDGTGAEAIPAEPGQFFLRAIDIQNGRHSLGDSHGGERHHGSLAGNSLYCGWPCFLRRQRRLSFSSRRTNRQSALAFQHRPAHNRFSHDVQREWKAIRRFGFSHRCLLLWSL